MNIAKFSIKNSLFIYALTLVAIIYGLLTYQKIGKLEDPEFTIKDALVITDYPGSSAKEVEKEITNLLEDAIQEMPEVKRIVGKSTAGRSLIVVKMHDKYDKNSLPQVWDKLRKKIADASLYLPPRAKKPIINDDFGDVYGIVFAIWGDEYSYDELKDYVEFLKKELILVDGVGKIDIFGEQRRALYLEFDESQLAKLGINKELVLKELYLQNVMLDFGAVKVGEERISIKAHNSIKNAQDLGNIIIHGIGTNTQILLKDFATIKDGYVNPPTYLLKYDGHNALALGISTKSGGNVIKMGQEITKKLQSLKHKQPLGLHVNTIAHQADTVHEAINSFMKNLAGAVCIVIVVLLLFMGFRSGLIIGFVLLVTILGSFVFMPAFGIMLERVSLGALIIALGMLVDNAIVVIDGMLVRMQQGMDKVSAAIEVVKQTALPLLAATAVAILAFGAIGLSEDATGEFTESLFWVVLISLGLSWVTAVTLTPLIGVKFLKVAQKKPQEQYSSFIYKLYAWSLKFSINHRFFVLFLAIGIFIGSLYGFKYVKHNFFPDSVRSQILVDYHLLEGSAIETTKDNLDFLEQKIKKLENVLHVTTFIGQGGPRFLLTYAPTHPNPSYGQMLIDIKDYKKADTTIQKIETLTKNEFANITVIGKKFVLGPGEGGKVQAKIFGEDTAKIREYGKQVLRIIKDDPHSKGVRSDWKNLVKVIRPVIADEVANLNGITRDDIARAILDTFHGRMIGVYKEGTQLIPIIVKSDKKTNEDIENIENIQIYSPIAQKMIPLRQIISSYKSEFVDNLIYTYNRKRALTVHADVKSEYLPNDLLLGVKSKIDNLKMDDGYYIEWHGEYKNSKDSQKPILESLPLFGGLMFLILLALFNSLKKTLIIWLTVPFALIGVVVGLLSMNSAFGFMSMLGFLSLSGMLIKNAIVLIDEITLESEVKKLPLHEAIYKSGISRLRAVTMAALTTALGMIPLVSDTFFSSMAIVIIFGLIVATFLTMILVPVFYAIFYKAKKLE